MFTSTACWKCNNLRAKSSGSGFCNVVFLDKKIFTSEAVHNCEMCATGKTLFVFVELVHFGGEGLPKTTGYRGGALGAIC
ncbi:hypothetical protein L596_026640 [Steinernema carpocapsae]|uniref:Uncharacterized protein n=1 Tax=Steinernema carpocapsae TaxID=34508 RepID=A0A4U5M1Y7_STECR|nr:hypothetical protein L596_026640 [Steinernema carpocapsae]